MNSHNMIESAQFIFCKDNKQIIAVGKKRDYSKECINIKEIINKFTNESNAKDFLLGAVSFDLSENTLFKPEIVYKHEFESSNIIDNQKDKVNEIINVERIPEDSQYKSNVNNALKLIERNIIEKAVISRKKIITFNKIIDIDKLFENLLLENRNNYTYLTKYNDKTLIGASPELLIKKRGNIISTNPLAGSRPKFNEKEKDQVELKELENSDKDLHEHSFVVSYIKKKLETVCKKLTIPEGPSIIGSDKMWHLSTKIEGELKENITSLELALLLHPTPAILGEPSSYLNKNIYAIEGYDRELFSGFIGWQNIEGDGEWAITLRCGLINQDTIDVFAGAGVVSNSTAQGELDETEAKMETIISNLE